MAFYAEALTGSKVVCFQTHSRANDLSRSLALEDLLRSDSHAENRSRSLSEALALLSTASGNLGHDRLGYERSTARTD